MDLNTKNAIINWNSFNIATGKTVQFNGTLLQNQAVLNRVTSTGSAFNSLISGTLSSTPNVAVYLVNPNGIVFGSGANVNVGALVASTLSVTDDDFTDLAGSIDGTDRLNFTNFTFNGVTASTGSTIRTTGSNGLGQLVLLGAFVQTDGGSSQTANSDVAYIAGRDITVIKSADRPLSITITGGTSGSSNPILVNSTVTGKNVTLAMATVQGVTASLLNVGGLVTATGVDVNDRGIVLAAGRSTSDNAVIVSSSSLTNGAASVSVQSNLISSDDIEIRSQGNIAVSSLASLDGRDIGLTSDGNIGTGAVNARDDIAMRALGSITTGALTSGTSVNGRPATDGSGAADAIALPQSLAGNDVDLQGNGVVVGAVRASGANSSVQIDGGATGIGNGDRDLDIQADSNLKLTGAAKGRDIALRASAIDAGVLTARDDVVLRAGSSIQTTGALTSGIAVDGLGALDATGAADTLAGASLAGKDIDAVAQGISIGSASANGANSEVRLQSTSVGVGSAGTVSGTAGVTIRSAGVASLGGGVTSSNGDVLITAVGATPSRFDIFAGGAVTVTGQSSVFLGNVRGAGAVQLQGGSLDVTLAISTGSSLAITAQTGALTLQTGEAATTATLTGRANGAAVTVTNAVRAGGTVTVGSNGDANLAYLQSTSGNILVQSSNVFGGTGFGSAATLAATNTAAGAGVVTVFTPGFAGLNTIDAGNNISIDAGSTITTRATATNGSLSIVANNGNATLGGGSAGTTATLRTTGGGGDVQVRTSLTSGGNATIESVSDANITQVTSTAGSVAVTATSGEVTGFSTNRATLLANGAGQDVTVNAGTRALLGNVVASRNVTVNADAIDIVTAQGRQSDSVVALNADAGDLALANAVSNGTVQLTASGAINATGRVLSVGNATATGGTAANLASIQSRTGNINVTGDTVNVGAATADTGSLTLAADAGNLTLGTGVAGTTADLRTTAGTGDVIVDTALTAGDNVIVNTVRNAQLAKVESLRGDISVTANSGGVTGVGAGGRGNLFANGVGGDVTVNARDLVLLQTAAAENTVSITGGTLDVDIVQARNGMLTLTANVDDLTLGAGAVGGNATLSAVRDVNLLRFLKARGNILLTGGRSVNGEEKATSSGGTVTTVEPPAVP